EKRGRRRGEETDPHESDPWASASPHILPLPYSTVHPSRGGFKEKTRRISKRPKDFKPPGWLRSLVSREASRPAARGKRGATDDSTPFQTEGPPFFRAHGPRGQAARAARPEGGGGRLGVAG